MTSGKTSLGELAIFGGPPARREPLPVGQLYFPSWQRYEATFRDIFARQYYTNHGPLAQEFERRLADYLEVRHAIAVTNGTVGLAMAAEALGLKGKVIVPAFTFVATAQALTWAGLEPVFCDVDPATHHMTPALVEPLIAPDVSAILAVNLWGGSCDPVAFEALARARGLQLFFDSAHAVGCRVGNTAIANFGDMEVFSFHATKVLGSAEGGCITTNDDELAAKLRNMRSSYGAGQPAEVVKTSNGRMSEAQAAIGLLNLEELPSAFARNQRTFDLYRARLARVAGVRVYEPPGVSRCNHQYVVCEIDESEFGLSRDVLLRLLVRENILARRYFYPGIHRSVPYNIAFPQFTEALPNTDRLCRSLIQFPIGALVEDDDVDLICGLIGLAQRHAREIKDSWRE